MCGLSAYVNLSNTSSPRESDIDSFMNLFVLSQLRGMDSTGAALMWKASAKKKKAGILEGWTYAKGFESCPRTLNNCLDAVEERYERRDRKQKYEKPEVKAILGHCRAATRGAVTVDNAHPFSFGNNKFVGVHNGTIYNAEESFAKLEKTGKPLEGFEEPEGGFDPKDKTDSEIVLYCIYKYGINQTYKHINGAWAFMWWDERDKTINIIRNHARTLFYAFDHISDGLFLSSEKIMLEFCQRRESNSIDLANIREFIPDLHYKLAVHKGQTLGKETKDVAWESKERVASYTAHTGGNVTNLYGVTSFCGRSNNSASNSHRIATLTDEEWETYCHSYGCSSSLMDTGEDDDPSEDTYPKNADNLDKCLMCGDSCHRHDADVLEVKGQGFVCGTCTEDLDTVGQVIEFFESACVDNEWVNKYISLQTRDDDTAAEEKRVRVH